MGSTGEPDRKRRHFDTIPPTPVTAKRQSFFPCTEDRKLHANVLQYQNQKLVQKLEAQKVERSVLENKLCQLKERQRPYNTTIETVNRSWESLVDGLESCSIRTKDLVTQGCDVTHAIGAGDPASSLLEDDFLSRLVETGATESCSAACPDKVEVDGQTDRGRTDNILYNLLTAINCLWYLKDSIHSAVLKSLPEDGSCKVSIDLKKELENFRLVLSELHLKHKSLAKEIQCHQDADAKSKAAIRHLRGELEKTIAELEESNCKLAALKAERDESKGSFLQVLNIGNKHFPGDRMRDKQKDLQDMETSLKELMDQASYRLQELMRLHEERIGILKQLSNLQNTIKNIKYISSSQAYLLLRNQLEKSKAEVAQYQALFEKLQVEKDNLVWQEKDINMKNDLFEIFQRSSAFTNVRINELEAKVQKQLDERELINIKLEEASREPGRKQIVAEFKALVASFPNKMGTMQSQLGKFKEAAADVHSLRAAVHSFSDILDRKAKKLEDLSARSAEQAAEIQKLHAAIHDLQESDSELKLFLDMFKRESTDSRDILIAKDSEYRAWAHIRNLRSSLDEHRLELRVKTANEAEAISQQRLAAAEAEISVLRQKWEASKRDLSQFSDVLKSKHEENEAYLSEIETIGQAYDDMQNQNQHLLQQITERDDYNIKLFLEGMKTKQMQDGLLMDKITMEKEIQHANALFDFFDMKTASVEDQVKVCDDQIQNLAEERQKNAVALENVQKKVVDASKITQQAQESLEKSQIKVDKIRVSYADPCIELEKVRFDKKRIEEDLEVARRKASRLKAQTDGSSVVGKLQKELIGYREILKCGICLDRPKQVVITKCYHLFCNPCIQRIIETRHRKCPECSASFGPNDVKPVYI